MIIEFFTYCTKFVAHSPKGLNVDNPAWNAGEIDTNFRNSEGVELVKHYFICVSPNSTPSELRYYPLFSVGATHVPFVKAMPYLTHTYGYQ